jgi:hypothetical protein
MKKILLFLTILLATTTLEIFAQDAPSGYTTYYGFRKWAENANPSADSLNQNWIDIDFVLYDLIVYTDGDQMFIENDTLKFASPMSGQDAFSGTATTDVVTVTGIDSVDVVVVSPRESTPGANDILGVTVGSGSFTVSRLSSGTSDLKYNWIWIKK